MSSTEFALSDPSGTERSGSWRLSPLFLVRVAGLPVARTRALIFHETAKWAGQVVAAETTLRANATGLCDLLAAGIGCCPDSAGRAALLRVRRDLHNLRLPKEHDLNQLETRLRKSLAGWLASFAAYRELRQAGDEVFEREVLDRRAALRELGRDPVLRKGILLASPTLDRFLPSYLDGTASAKRARRIERSLVEYTLRAALKTSPFSTFTTVGLGSFGRGTASLFDASSATGTSHARLNLTVLAQLSALVAVDEHRMADLPVTVTPGCERIGDRIRYLRRRQALGTETEEGAGHLDTVHEDLLYLPIGPVLREVLGLFAEGEVVQLRVLHERLGGTDAIWRYLVRLYRLGFLICPGFALDLGMTDPVARYLKNFESLDAGWAEEPAHRLRIAYQATARYGHADLTGRRTLLNSVRQEISAAYVALGSELTLPRNVIYEDVTPDLARVQGSMPAWKSRLLPQLSGVADLLSAFDAELPTRLLARWYFRQRFGTGGRCSDLLAYAHEFRRDLYAHYQDRLRGKETDWFATSELRAVAGVRSALANRVAECSAADEVTLSQSDLQAILSNLPASVRGIASWSLFGQLHGPDFVLNQAYSGWTLMFSRFAHCFADQDIVARLRSVLLRSCPEGAVFAEVRGGYETSNLNLHPSVTDYELVCPGELRDLASERQLPIADLELIDDPESGELRLWSHRLRCRVIPVYLGFLHPIALPEVQRILLALAPMGMASFSLTPSAVEIGDGVVKRPRVRCGRIILQRRSWTANPTALSPGEAETSAAKALRWARFRERHGIPVRVFAREVAADNQTWANRKPLPIDFHNQFALDLLDDLTRNARGPVEFTESLPDSHDGQVSELIVELTRQEVLK
ncbi:lantibiotic dehydratase [Amycolatopsis circi]|uniref:lantibiotic dehydratase n=1 Tax=Amycolatopsis circi TaxID=871959 RepID=UPI0013BEA39A|nr:lantibiotic dehydratase [Amycolatopsis circi]